MTGRSPKRTCAQPEKIRVIPENEIPPAMRVDIYLHVLIILTKFRRVQYPATIGQEVDKKRQVFYNS